MSLFNNMLRDNESLFLNAVALDYDYQPKIVPYREAEQRRIASCITPLFQKRNGANILVTGKPGVGKTVACRKILEEVSGETDDIIPLYVNCWQKNTSYKIFVELCYLMEYRFVQNKKTDEIFDILKKMLNKKCVVFIFDEVDKVEDLDFLYSILEDIYRKTIILITNFKGWLPGMDERVRSRLVPEVVEFKPYNKEETRGILDERRRVAFVPNVWNSDAFERIVDKTAELQDLRTGLYLLKESGNAAENRSSKSIESVDVDSAFAKLGGFTQKQADVLDDEDRMILDLIEETPSIRMGDLYKLFESKGGKGVYKTFQRRIDRLADDNFIDAKLVQGKDGTSKVLNIKRVV